MSWATSIVVQERRARGVERSSWVRCWSAELTPRWESAADRGGSGVGGCEGGMWKAGWDMESGGGASVGEGGSGEGSGAVKWSWSYACVCCGEGVSRWR